MRLPRQTHQKGTTSARGKLPHFPIRFCLRNGRFHRVGSGDCWLSYWRDPYHLTLTVPWWGFFLLIGLLYGSVNLFFACAYLLGGDGIANAEPGSFADAFFFSVQTLATIGYGAMYPTTTYAHILVAIESLTGTVGVAIITGLAFARFAQPTARVLFSRVAVVTTYHGQPTLMFRTANQRGNQILEAEIRLYLLRDEISTEGHFMRRFYDLKLLRERTPSFSLTWTAMHPIDEYSPLYKATAETLEKTHALLIVSLSGIDQTVSQVIHARHSYSVRDLVWHQHFVDIIYDTDRGDRYIDINHFHKTVPSVRPGEDSRHDR